MLKKAGHRPAEAEDGLIGMQMAAETRYDLIFTDISMPRLDGMAATKLIRNGGLSRHAIIIAVTAHAMPEEIDRFKQAQIDDFLLKPVRISSLQQCLLRHFQAQPQAAAPISAKKRLSNFSRSACTTVCARHLRPAARIPAA